MNFDQLKSRAIELKAVRNLTRASLDSCIATIERLNDRKAGIESAILAIQVAAANTQDKIRQHFIDVTQSAIDAIFPDEYEFRMDFVAKRNKTEVDIYLLKDGSRMNPMESNGGGLVDVISFALRIACLSVSRSAKILLMDEPFPHLRGEARNRLGNLVRGISRRLGIQIIMVADVSGCGMDADKVFNVTKHCGKSKIEEVGNEESK